MGAAAALAALAYNQLPLDYLTLIRWGEDGQLGMFVGLDVQSAYMGTKSLHTTRRLSREVGPDGQEMWEPTDPHHKRTDKLMKDLPKP